MKNNPIEVLKTNSTIIKKESCINFKQALSKKYSKKSDISPKQDKNKTLKKNRKSNSRKSTETTKKKMKPFLSKKDTQKNNNKKTTEKIKNLLKYASNNNLAVNNMKKNLKNKSTTNLGLPTKNITSKKSPILDNSKSPKLNDFFLDNNEINQELSNGNFSKTNYPYLITKNQNYDDDSVFLNINESYIDYINNNNQQQDIKKRNIDIININKKEYLSEDYSVKNNIIDNKDNNSLISSIININKFLTNEINHKAVNNIKENVKKNSKPHKVYENQLLKTPYAKDLNKTKEELKNNNNNENDKNINNINKKSNFNRVIDFDNNNNNSKNKTDNHNLDKSYKRQIINKVLKSKYSGTVQKPSITLSMKKRNSLNLEDLYENNFSNRLLTFNTHSPDNSTYSKNFLNYQYSPNISKITRNLFNLDADSTIKNNDENYPIQRIRVSKAKKYKNSSDKVLNKKKSNNELNEKNIKSNNNINSFCNDKNKKNNNINLINNKNNISIKNNLNNLKEYKLINENILNSNFDINYNNNNIFDREFYDNTVDIKNDNLDNDIIDIGYESSLNKYINYVDRYNHRKTINEKNFQNSSSNCIYPTITNYTKYNTLLNQAKYYKNKISISNFNSINRSNFRQEDDNNNSRIQEIKIKLKNPKTKKNLNSSVNIDTRNLIKNYNQNINVLNARNSTINICKNRFNIVNVKQDDNNETNNISSIIIQKNNNKSISNVMRNKNKTFVYSSSQSPSYRYPKRNKNYFYDNNDNYLNNSNDKIRTQKIYIKQIFNYNFNSKTKTHNNLLKLVQKNKSKINEKNIHNLLKTEPNKFNHINKFYTRNNLHLNVIQQPIENYNMSEMDYLNIDHSDLYNNQENNNNNNNIFQQKNFYTTNNFFYPPEHKININPNNNINENIYINKVSSPKIYIKPSKCSFKKNNFSSKIINLSPSKSPTIEPCSPHKNNNNIFSNFESESPIISTYRNNFNDNTNRIRDNYFNDIEFINNTKTNEKLNKNIMLYDIQKSKTKAYIKKSCDINFNKRNNTKICLLKNKVSNNNNSKFTKYYNYYLSRKQMQIIKKPSFCSKYIKKPKVMPINKRNFITKIIYKCYKRVKSEICYIDKEIIKNDDNNNNLTFYTKDKNNNEGNIIKANILDFSLEQKQEMVYNNINPRNKNYFHRHLHNDKDNQESVGEINLSFSTDEINTFKYKESTIEAVFNELNNINLDSEVKVTFGHDNINNNSNNNFNNNVQISTEGRSLNECLNDTKYINNANKKNRIIRSKLFKNNDNDNNININDNIINEQNQKISSVIIYDNEEENEDIKIDLDLHKEEDKFHIENENENINERIDNEALLLDIKPNEEGNLQLKIDKVKINNDKCNDDNNVINKDLLEGKKKRKTINSTDVINFAQKLGNIFEKKKNDSNNNDHFNNLNIYNSNYNIGNNRYIIPDIINKDFINKYETKSRTYMPKANELNNYLDILNHDLEPSQKLETKKEDDKDNLNQNKNDLINEKKNEN